ncbi:serine hydrolase domain-containing protein [Pedobacter sp. V48]|uniref:serine hydrolase n=1 Tax=Pedobacter sp. V48 TaxID=509635 RepID=UPI000A0484B2
MFLKEALCFLAKISGPKPGEKFSYSNIGYRILGLALSKAAKKPFIELIEIRIFEPLNMNSSYFVVP